MCCAALQCDQWAWADRCGRSQGFITCTVSKMMTPFDPDPKVHLGRRILAYICSSAQPLWHSQRIGVDFQIWMTLQLVQPSPRVTKEVQYHQAANVNLEAPAGDARASANDNHKTTSHFNAALAHLVRTLKDQGSAAICVLKLEGGAAETTKGWCAAI